MTLLRNIKEYRFNIINMMKPDSLYNAGMKPLIYSEALAKQKSKFFIIKKIKLL